MNKIKTVIIPIAGRGERLLPITKVLIKTLMPIINKPVIQYIIEEAVNANIEHIIIVINNNQQVIKDYLNTNIICKGLCDLNSLLNKVKIDYVIQPELKGLADAIYCCKDYITDEVFGIMLGDDLIFSNHESSYGIKDLILCYNHNPANYIGIQEVTKDETNKYGIIDYIKSKKPYKLITNIIEKPSSNPPSCYAIVGRYLLQKDIFDIISKFKQSNEKEILFTDCLKSLKCYGVIFKGTRFDIGDKTGFIKANITFSLENKETKEEINKYIKNIRLKD